MFDSIEIQRLSINERTGFAALLHTSKGIDLYVDPTLKLDQTWFASDPAYANLQRNSFVSTPIEVEHWDISDGSVSIDVQLRLADNQMLRFKVSQRKLHDRVFSQFIPTPAIEHIVTLRFLEVHGFGLLRRSAQVNVSIGNEQLVPARFVLPIGGRARLAARFAQSCSVIGLNPTGEHPLNAGPSNPLTWDFDPRLDDFVNTCAIGDQSQGRVTFAMNVGSVSTADYCYTREDDGFRIRLSSIEQAWKPPLRSLKLRILAELRRRKRQELNWCWSGLVDFSRPKPFLTQSQWTEKQ